MASHFHLECSSRYPCAGLGTHANFHSLSNSMLTLFRIATGDNWSGILKVKFQICQYLLEVPVKENLIFLRVVCEQSLNFHLV